MFLKVLIFKLIFRIEQFTYLNIFQVYILKWPCVLTTFVQVQFTHLTVCVYAYLLD